MSILIASIVTLSVIGCVSAVILYFVAKKFKVEEDERIDLVEAVLPGANCGGCGFPGCRGFADACVKADTLDGKLCPVGGQPVMAKVAEILGLTASEATPKIAVVRCNGNCSARPRTSNFTGTRSCAIIAQLYGGETDCPFGCLGCGDCVDACAFDAIRINPSTGLPEVDEEKCTACGACVKACPKKVIELRNKGPKGRRVFVSCINREKGAKARKACASACIGCGKCAKACPFGAITVTNNLAYIDFEKCRLCRKCVAECPTGAIHDVNFPTPAPKPEKKAADPATAAPKPAVARQPDEKPVAEEKPTVAESKPTEETVIEVVEQPESAATVAATEDVKNDEPKQEPIVETPAPETTPATPAETITTAPAMPDEIPDDFDINSLIPDELRVVPREKAKENKTSETQAPDAIMPKLDL